MLPCYRRPVILVVTNIKGGVGKTTAAMHLAAAVNSTAPVVVIDADAQGSAIRWAAAAKQAGEPLPFDVESLATRQLALKLDDLAAGRHVIIDTGPGDASIITAAIDVADAVVIPANASEDDVEQARVTVKQCTALEIPCGVLLSRVRVAESLPTFWRDTLRAEGVRVFDTWVPELVRLRAFGAGITDPAPFDQLLTEILAITPETV